MTPARRRRALSPASVAVLRALSAGVTYGFDLMDETGLPSGTVYPILGRMERRGLVESRWEDPAAPREQGRPPRKYYDITDLGREALAEGLARLRSMGVLRAGEA